MQHKKYLEKLSNYFQQEMFQLAEGGRQFAAQYPKIAQRLLLQPTGSDDPHVARLLESFAFLTARLSMKVDDQYTLFTSALLGALYPQFLNPIPSAAIVKLGVLSGMARQVAGTMIPAQTSLLATSNEGHACRFLTTMATALWPLEVESVSVVPAQATDLPLEALRSSRVLRMRLCVTDGDLSVFPIQKLCFHIAGDCLTSNTLYEWLFTYDATAPTPVFLQQEGQDPQHLPKEALQPVGFNLDQMLVPLAAQAHHAYQLLLEYFVFPQKFMFFEIQGLPPLQSGRLLDFFIPLGERAAGQKLFINADNIQLGCVPAVNLFSKTAEPIRLDHRTLEYRLVGDHSREQTTEIHSILKVSAAVDANAHAQVYFPYFSFNHAMGSAHHPCFWAARRVACTREGLEGTDLFLSFVDYNLDPQLPPEQTIYAHTLCTNRQLAVLIPPQAHLEIQGVTSGVSAFLIERPTPAILPPLEGQVQWRLISHLALNHLGLFASGGGVEALRELLRLYRFIENNPWQSIENALLDCHFHQTMGRIHQEAWRGFVPQLSIDLIIDEKSPTSHGLFLLGMVLDRLFRLSAGFNTLVETALLGDESQQVWKRFPPSLATQVSL